jgi:meckelin
MKYNSVFRVGIAFPVLIGTGIHSFYHILSLIIIFLAFIQYFFYIIFYQRLIADKIMNFIDLCSVSNISVFILDQNRHGYYIHGRSPHGTTDVNIKDMIMNLERESRLMSGTRGLQANSKEQIFIMKINREFRIQYELLFRKYYVRKFFLGAVFFRFMV